MGWLLFLYAANTSTPVTAYKDTGLTAGLEHPWPIAADSSGMMPSFWLADGSYRARATSNDGSRTFFDLTPVLALGASSGTGGGGGAVDPNAIFQTGDVIWQETQGARSGWVRDNGRTIGSATSGATERANNDCLALFTFLYNTYSDTLCPVVGGRGANAAADWAANKQLTLRDKRGYIVGGLDDMGNSAASRYAGVPIVSGSVTAAGSVIGETATTLNISQMPSHDHGGLTGFHNHNISNFLLSNINSVVNGGTGFHVAGGVDTNGFTDNAQATISAQGGGSAHNSVQQTVLGSFYRKL